MVDKNNNKNSLQKVYQSRLKTSKTISGFLKNG